MTAENAAAADGALIGHSIDERYRLEGVIGMGGLGSVYRATHTKLQRPVAVKMLHEGFGESQVQRGRFAREAKALAALQHPNIVSVLDYGVAGARPYLVMELLEGETLSQRLQRGLLPVASALQIIQQLLEALSFMHRAQLVHRDVKPSNVFLQRLRDGRERVKVLDLGLAKFTASASFHGDPTLTRDGAILGTPAYMSPEQATGEAVDARSDVYAVGVILFRMLSGRLPFEGDAIEQVRSHLIAPVPALERAEPDEQLDPAFEALIERAMAKRREDRFDDAGQMLRELAAAFPQYVRSTLPAHESVLPDPFAVDANHAEWLLSQPDDPSNAETMPRVPRVQVGAFQTGVRTVGRALRTVVIASVRLFAGVSVLLVVGAGAIIILLLRDEADRAELTALQRRVSDRLIEHSLGGVGERAPESARPAATRQDVAVQPAGLVGTDLDAATDTDPALNARADAAVVEPASERAELAAANDSALAPPRATSGLDPPVEQPSPSASAPGGALGTPPAPHLPSSSGANPVELEAAAPNAGAELAAAARALEAAGPEVAAAPVEGASVPGREPPAEASGAAGAGATEPGLVPQPSATPPEPVAVADELAVPPRDPWLAPVPARLRVARRSMLNGGRGSEPLFTAVREYNKAQREDPRGHLILGQLYLNRFWRADALSQFSIALQLDPSVRGAPEVLEGLLALVVHGALAPEAERVITNRFGAEAVPAVERLIEREARNADPKVVTRLRRLHARLRAAR